MKQLKNDEYILTASEVDMLACLITHHPEDPRECVQDAIREAYGEGSVTEYEILYAMERVVEQLGIGHNESDSYIPVMKRRPISCPPGGK